MRGIKLSGLSNNHCLVSFSNTDNYISKCELSNIALLMLCFNFLLVYRSQGSLTLAMGKCLWLSVKIKICQSSLSSP